MQLRSYQQQYEKLKAQYAERAMRVDAATKVRHCTTPRATRDWSPMHRQARLGLGLARVGLASSPVTHDSQTARARP